jgi:hypothetical protein
MLSKRVEWPQDVALIRRLRDFTPRIAIIVTKLDLLSEVQGNEGTAFIRGGLHREFGIEFPIFGFSIRPDYRNLATNLEQELLRPAHRGS